ncbi:MAG: hypothetical protein K9N34_05660 [Candidatus Marinimicrobia bacterium]|nr:hypothetical protein [Candidatus Neomarinimicrobiota bacterium]MCF7840378.1 hypothetical protein [Candidatus Neomarinimicrobiota bacterium]
MATLKNIFVILSFAFTLFVVPGISQINLIFNIDTAYVQNTCEWAYYKTQQADLNGDGIEEKIEILANVMRTNDSKGFRDRDFNWDDGQKWTSRIIEQAGDTTWIFYRWIQNGRLNGFISTDDPPSIILVQTDYNSINAYKVIYFKHDSIEVSQILQTKHDSEFHFIERDK